MTTNIKYDYYQILITTNIMTVTFVACRLFCGDYVDCFGEAGLIKNPYKVQLKSDMEPVVHVPRRVLIALKDRSKKNFIE